MIKTFLVLLFFLPIYALANVRLDINFAETKVKQGSLTDATVSIAADQLSSFELQKLKGQTLAKTLYFYQLSPWINQQAEGRLQAQVKVIFVVVPTSTELHDKLETVDLDIHLSPVQVEPTEAAEKLLFGTFTVPKPVEVLRWILIALGILLIGGIGWLIYKKFKLKADLRNQKRKTRDEIISAQTYEDVVSLWKKKHFYQQQFPHVADPFRDLETILFKYQFKPYQSEAEKDEVVQAYRKFVQNCQGGFHGI